MLLQVAEAAVSGQNRGLGQPTHRDLMARSGAERRARLALLAAPNMLRVTALSGPGGPPIRACRGCPAQVHARAQPWAARANPRPAAMDGPF